MKGVREILNKKGSSTILISIVISAIIFALFAYIAATKRIGTIGFTNSVATLAAKSVISEYDLDLKEKYGLFAFAGTNENVESKISEYINYSFWEKRDVDLQLVQAEVGEYGLGDLKNAEKEIIDYSKFALARGIIKELTEGSYSRPFETKDESYEKEDVCLRNKNIIEMLPSKMYKKKESVVGKIKESLSGGDNFLQKGKDGFLIDQYILSVFKNRGRQETLYSNSFGYKAEGKRDTFFQNEVEYVLNGDFKDKNNYDDAKGQILLIRNAANLIHIYADPQKITALTAAANAITPGPAAVATQAALAEAWALAEGNNDIKLLERGKKVPLIKTKDSWAIDLDVIVENKEEGYIDTNCKVGLSYQGYLLLLLTFTEKSIKVARTLDLIQINIQGGSNRNFLIKEHNIGFNIKLKVNHKTYEYTEKY